MTALLLDGAAVVVTGAGSGIGAALARRLTAAGARVVVNDRDPVAAQRVAAEVGGPAFPADVTDPAQVAALVDFAWESFGALDLFCANAGVAPPADAPNAWELAWRVNMLAQYAVTKHAAVSYAEWLRASYAHRGITVQALCPQGVRTPMLEASGPGGGVLLDPGAISAEEVAEAVVEALGGDSFLVLPHGEVADFYQRRATDPDRWLRGMNRLQQDLEKRLGTG